MTPEYINIIAALQAAIEQMTALKGKPDSYDGRSLSVAITHAETAQLWFTNAVKESGS